MKDFAEPLHFIHPCRVYFAYFRTEYQYSDINIPGPSITYYSGICGGIDALTAAYENLTNGRIDAAIVGASASLIDPKLSLNYQLMGMLSADGLCRVFDAQGNLCCTRYYHLCCSKIEIS